MNIAKYSQPVSFLNKTENLADNQKCPAEFRVNSDHFATIINSFINNFIENKKVVPSRI